MKLMTTLVAVLGLTAFGCDKKEEEGTVQKRDPGAAAKATEQTKPAEPKVETLQGAALAEAYKACVEHINNARWDDVKKACVADGYTIHAFGGMPERKGADSLITFFKDMKTAMPDWKLSPQFIMVNGRNILAVNLITGTHSGPMKSPMGEVPATNKKLGMLMFHRLKLNEANKATDEWAMADAMTMMKQLGMAPKDAPPSRPVMDKGIEGAPIVVVTSDDAKEKTNLETVTKGNEAFLANKPADMMATMTDDAVEMDQASAQDTKGKKEIEKGFKQFRNAWSDAKMSNVEAFAAGDYVVQLARFEAKHDKDLGKLKKTGKNVAVDVVEVMRFKDGKIDQIWRFFNGMDFAQQLGLAPPPGAAPGGAAPAGDTGGMKKEPEKK